jgi:hypothetical protein
LPHGRRPYKSTMTSKTDHGPKAPVSIPQTKPTGQKRSLERGKATRKKNPGKRAGQGGS